MSDKPVMQIQWARSRSRVEGCDHSELRLQADAAYPHTPVMKCVKCQADWRMMLPSWPRYRAMLVPPRIEEQA